MWRALAGICFAGWLASTPAMAISKSAPAPMNATPAMWTVRGVHSTVYLLGSIHALPKNVNWQTPVLMAAICQADVFAFEVKMDGDSRVRAAAYFRANAVLPGSVSLPSLFDADMREQFREVMMLTHADPTYVVYMRPWLA